MFAKASRLLRELWSYAFLNDEEKRLLQKLEELRFSEDGREKVFVQVVEDYNFLFKFFLFLKVYFEKIGERAGIEWVWVSIPFRNNRSFKGFFIHEKLKQPLLKRKWCRFFLGLGGRLVFSQGGPSKTSQVKKEARLLFEKIRNPQDIVLIEKGDIVIGDLVYDTYLRFKGVSTVDIKHPFLLELLEWSLALILAYEDIFSKRSYRCYLCSYTSYIQHGIAARMAMKFGIPVFSLGTDNQIVVQPTKHFPFHKRNFHRYSEWVHELSDKERASALQIGHEGLRKRLSGVIDDATWYMRQSAYASSGEIKVEEILPPKKKKTILVMGHDFFDSPHIYGDMLYPDFHLWLEAVLSKLPAEEVEILVKPHPNGIDGNAEIYESFRQRFPKVFFLPPKTSTLDLVRRGVDLALTVYGTVAHELPYIGIPVVCAGDNPHSTFAFSLVAATIPEFEKILSLRTPVSLSANVKDEVALFYFVHNYRTGREKLWMFPYYVSCSDVLQWFQPGPDLEMRKKLCRESLDAVDKI